MEKGSKSRKWLKQKNNPIYKWHDVKRKINQPKPLKRGLFSVPELDIAASF
jgi:hypothetical protein